MISDSSNEEDATMNHARHEEEHEEEDRDMNNHNDTDATQSIQEMNVETQEDDQERTRTTTATTTTRLERWRIWWRKPNTIPLLLICCVTAGLNADQLLLAPSLSVVAKEFGMNDIDRDVYLGGYISLGFFLIGGTTTLLTGYFSDRVERRKFFVVLVYIGELACLSTLLVKDFWGLFITRSLTGISLAGSLPVIYSMLGDMFPENERGKAVVCVQITLSIGIGIGQLLAGVIAPRLGWRAPFAFTSIPTMIIALVYFVCSKEPVRGGMETRGANGEMYDGQMDRKKYLMLIKTPTVCLICLQGIPGSIPWGILTTYFQDYLINDVGGISSDQSVLVVFGLGIGSLLGGLFGGVANDYLWQRKYEYVTLLMSATTIAGAFPMYAVLQVTLNDFVPYFGVLIPVGFLASITGSVIRSVLLNVTLPETRGSAFGLFTLFDDVGRALGPYFAALIIQAAGGRKQGFYYGFMGWFGCGVLLFLMTFTIRKDKLWQVKAIADHLSCMENQNHQKL